MTGSSEENSVILECKNSDSTEEDGSGEVTVSIPDIQSWDLSTISSYKTVKFRVGRERLSEQSSYFRSLLGGSFSTSCSDCISVQWNLETFITILKFIWDCPIDIRANNFLPLLEGGLYFGVDPLLLQCKTWFSEVSSSVGPEPLQIQLDDLIQIWDFGLEHATDWMAELCVGYLARNFMLSISSSSFVNLPYKLLVSCLKHPHLTVDSEMDLSDALLVWLDANRERSEFSPRNENDCTNILRQIPLSLLPLWFALGKRRSCHFSELAEESIHTIFSLMNTPSTSSVKIYGDGEFHLPRLRLTEYSKKVNLSGCPQITVEILHVVLPSTHVNTVLRKGTNQSSSDIEHFDRQCTISRGIVQILSFASVQEVDVSNSPRLHLGAAVECFNQSFPSLRRLKAAYHLNFKISALGQLVQMCPLVSEVDLTVDSSPVIPTKVSIISSSPAVKPLSEYGYHSRVSMSNISKLTLKGRADVYDSDLMDISGSCLSLSYLNLKDCMSITDTGISNIISGCVKLHSLIVCNTSFGRNSISSLCSRELSRFPYKHVESIHSESPASRFQKLHMGGCKDVDEMSLLGFLSQAPTLRSLCLMETHLSDRVLLGFSGSSLEVLDVSNTKESSFENALYLANGCITCNALILAMVSGTALAHIVGGNSGMKCLKAKGCKNLVQKENSIVGGEVSPYSLICKELYFELGKACALEEIAFGWGFSCFSLEPLKPAIKSLRVVNVGLGGSLGEDALNLLPTTCPILESVILYFQVISDTILRNIMESLRQLHELTLCYCLGDISILSFQVRTPNLRRLRLKRVTPWMTNDDLVLLTRNCSNLIDLSLVGCKLLNSDAQQIISHGWPGLISLHLEECGKITAKGVSSLLDCKALEDLLLRHNGAGIERLFIFDVASKLPMLRKLSLDLCDSIEGCFDLPNFADKCFLSYVSIADASLGDVQCTRRP